MTRQTWLFAGLLASLALLSYQKRVEIKTTVEDFMTPRGIRNNNPGNIRHSATKWQGEALSQTDDNFVQFQTPEYGIRALSHLLDTYAAKHGINTVRGVVERFAPSVENDTEAYIQAVADSVGVAPDSVITIQAHKQAIIAAIIAHENGVQPYTLAQINTGAMMA